MPLQVFSDQPGLRHAGLSLSRQKQQKTATKSSTQLAQIPQPLRSLKMNDAILSTALAISFASFIRTDDDGSTIINGDF